MRALLSGLMLAVLPMCVRGQAVQEHKIGFSEAEIEMVNNSLARGGAKSRIASLALYSATASASSLSGVRYVRGELVMKCGTVAKKVDVATTHFILSLSSELSERMVDSLRSEGLAILPPDSVVARVTNNPEDSRDLLRQVMTLAFKICNTEPGRADYIALSVWADGSPASIFPPTLVYKLIDSVRYRELSR